MGTHGDPALAVIQGHPPRGLPQGGFNSVFWNANPEAVDPGSASGQNLTRFFVVYVNPHPFQHLKRGQMDPATFGLPHSGVMGTGHPASMCADH